MKFVKILEPSNCVSSSMCNFENGGFCRFLWSNLSKPCLNCLKHINHYKQSERLTAISGPFLRFDCNFGPKN